MCHARMPGPCRGARRMPDSERNQAHSLEATPCAGHAHAGRRAFVVALAGVAALCAAHPRAQGKLHRIGFLGNSTAALEANLVGPFREGLRALGYIEGKNLVMEYRWAEGDYQRFPRLVSELAKLDPEVIVTAGTPASLAVQRGASSIPLMMVAVGDPVGTGLVKSLAVPGGNSTGLTSIAPDLEGKRLQLMKEVVPKLARVALLMNPANPFHVGAQRQARAAAGELGLKLDVFSVRKTEELAAALEAMLRERPDAFSMLADRVFLHDRKQIVEFAARNRLPAVYAY